MCLTLLLQAAKYAHRTKNAKYGRAFFQMIWTPKRIQALRSNLERLGVWNTAVIRARAHDLSLWYPRFLTVFD